VADWRGRPARRLNAGQSRDGFGLLPLFHTLVEERGGERRFDDGSPSPYPSSRAAGRGNVFRPCSPAQSHRSRTQSHPVALSRTQSHSVAPSRTQSHQSNPEDATEANEASLSRSDLASRQFPFVTFCSNLCTPLLYARFSRNFAPTSAARSSRSHPVKPIGDSQRSSLPVKPVALSQTSRTQSKAGKDGPPGRPRTPRRGVP
jgi:hypothetical protein